MLYECIVCGNASAAAPSEYRPGYVRCAHCKALRNWPPPTAEDITRFYAARCKQENYFTDISRFDALRKGAYAGYLKTLTQLAGVCLKGASVIDVGCFTGLSLEVLQDMGATPYGIEFHPDAAKAAQLRFPGHVVHGDVCADWPAGRIYDVVTMTDVLEHLPDPAAALAKVRNSMSPGGYLLLTTPNTSSIVAMLQGQFWPSLCPVHHIHLFNAKNLAMFLASAGFHVVATRPVFKWYTVEYVKWVLPSLKPSLAKFVQLLPSYGDRLRVPMNGGEMLVIAEARKPSQTTK